MNPKNDFRDISQLVGSQVGPKEVLAPGDQNLPSLKSNYQHIAQLVESLNYEAKLLDMSQMEQTQLNQLNQAVLEDYRCRMNTRERKPSFTIDSILNENSSPNPSQEVPQQISRINKPNGTIMKSQECNETISFRMYPKMIPAGIPRVHSVTLPCFNKTRLTQPVFSQTKAEVKSKPISPLAEADYYSIRRSLMLQPLLRYHNGLPIPAFQSATAPLDERYGNEGGKPRQRTTFTAAQLAILESAFNNDNYPQQPERRQLAKIIDVRESQIKSWFQNRRMKQKKMHGDRYSLKLALPDSFE